MTVVLPAQEKKMLVHFPSLLAFCVCTAPQRHVYVEVRFKTDSSSSQQQQQLQQWQQSYRRSTIFFPFFFLLFFSNLRHHYHQLMNSSLVSWVAGEVCCFTTYSSEHAGMQRKGQHRPTVFHTPKQLVAVLAGLHFCHDSQWKKNVSNAV